MSQRNLFILLIVTSIVLLFAHLGLLYVDIMEARNFVSAREMADEGHWIFTTMNDVPRYEKPPLPTWFTAFMGEIFGFRNIAALRFPAALSAFLLIYYFLKIVRLISGNKKLAFISSLILVTNFLVIYVGRRNNWDIFSYSFMVIGIYYFILALKDYKIWRNFSLAGLMFGLSILSKGPTGPYVLLIPFIAAYLITYGLPKGKIWGGIVGCAIVSALIGFSWYIYIYIADPETFMSIMKKEAMARENRNVKPFTRYLSFPVQTGIWIFYSVIGLIFPWMKNRTNQPKVYMFFFYWTVFALFLLSLVPSKKERYLFPMMVPLAATTGFYLYFLFRNIVMKKWELNLNKIIFSILAMVCLLISAGVFLLPAQFSIYNILFSVSAFACAVALVYFIYGNRSFEKAFYTLIFLMISTGLFGIPVIDKMLNNNKNFKSLSELKPKIEQEHLKLYAVSYMPEVWFRYQGIIPQMEPDDPSTFPKEKSFYLAMEADNKHEVLEKLSNLGWKLTYIGTFDENEEAEPSKNHVGRKVHLVYKVEK